MTRMTETLPDLTYRYSTLPGRKGGKTKRINMWLA